MKTVYLIELNDDIINGNGIFIPVAITDKFDTALRYICLCDPSIKYEDYLDEEPELKDKKLSFEPFEYTIQYLRIRFHRITLINMVTDLDQLKSQIKERNDVMDKIDVLKTQLKKIVL